MAPGRNRLAGHNVTTLRKQSRMEVINPQHPPPGDPNPPMRFHLLRVPQPSILELSAEGLVYKHMSFGGNFIFKPQ